MYLYKLSLWHNYFIQLWKISENEFFGLIFYLPVQSNVVPCMHVYVILYYFNGQSYPISLLNMRVYFLKFRPMFVSFDFFSSAHWMDADRRKPCCNFLLLAIAHIQYSRESIDLAYCIINFIALPLLNILLILIL